MRTAISVSPLFILLILLLIFAACSQMQDAERLPPYVRCEESQRNAVCTMEYDPVCADVETGARCAEASCPGTQNITYPNRCGACSDPLVSGYWPGECDSRAGDS
jgi:hypothetical protein